MQIIKIGLLIILMGIASVISSKISGIPILELTVLALTIAPLGLLQKSLHDHSGSGSIFFNQNVIFFRLLSVIFGIALLAGLFLYGRKNGFGATMIYFLIAAIIQGPYYAILKRTLPGEIILIPFEIIGLVVFYYFAVF